MSSKTFQNTRFNPLNCKTFNWQRSFTTTINLTRFNVNLTRLLEQFKNSIHLRICTKIPIIVRNKSSCVRCTREHSTLLSIKRLYLANPTKCHRSRYSNLHLPQLHRSSRYLLFSGVPFAKRFVRSTEKKTSIPSLLNGQVFFPFFFFLLFFFFSNRVPMQMAF